MKLCVFQGTFNPIHKAHLRVVKFVIDNYNFDKIMVIPALNPPHKDLKPEMSKHRFNMTKIAFKGWNNVEVSDIEFQRNEKSYTYITICELYEKYQIEDKINFIIGTDAFQNIEGWYETDKLKKLVKFIVFEREEKFSPLKYDYLKEKGYEFEIQPLEFEDVSSSELRDYIKKGKNISLYLPQKVKEYIDEYCLYRN